MITMSAVIVGGFCVLAYTSTHAYVRAYLTFDTVQHMSARVLGGHEDFCGAVGMHTRKALAKHWVWPVVVPGWFRGGTRPKHRCGKRKRHQYALSYLDRDTDTLVVSTQCWSSAPQPSVLLEWPSGVPDLSPEQPYGMLYHRYVEEKYGTAEKARAAGVVVRRNRKNKQIDEVELDPALLKPVERRAAAPGSAEAAVRAHWRSPSTVLEIPLGASVSYTVRCPRVDAAYRELHLYPLDPRARGSSGVAHDDRVLPTASRIGRDEPPGSVLFILQDAVSRQEAVRSLPLFSEWMRQFRDRQARKANGTGFVVAEPLHHATAGMSSYENIPPMICGATMSTLQIYFGPQRTNGTRPQAPNETIFYEFKSRYGETVETTLTTAACVDIVGVDCDTPLLPGSGHAHLAGGIDRHLYFPFCDREYADEHVYVPTPRCMAGRTPAKHSHDYISHLLGKRARLSEGSAPHPRFFFDIAYFLEGHEASQTVLASEDRQLRDFMRHLEEDLHFFDNPHNAFILGSDHGIHYGNYFTGSLAGRLERTTPMMLFAFHPEMMRRVDQMKNRTEGTSLKNFQKRLGGFNSQYDLGMTLHDILGIPDLGLRLYENNTIKPASYFDVRDEVPLQCYDYRGPMPDSPSCTLDYCEK